MFYKTYWQPLRMNPAFVGFANNDRITATYHKPAKYNYHYQYNLSGESFSEDLNSAFGVHHVFQNFGSGRYKISVSSFDYAYRFPTEKFDMQIGIEVGRYRQNIEGNGLDRTSSETTALDLSGGFIAFKDQYYWGLAAHHIGYFVLSSLSPAYYRVPVRASVHGGYVFNLSEDSTNHHLVLEFAVMQQESINVRQLGCFYVNKWFNAGFHLRQAAGNTFVPAIGIDLKWVQLRYARKIYFDQPVAYINGVVQRFQRIGEHEATLTIAFPRRKSKLKRFAWFHY